MADLCSVGVVRNGVGAEKDEDEVVIQPIIFHMMRSIWTTMGRIKGIKGAK